jgi:hypothetical protein
LIPYWPEPCGEKWVPTLLEVHNIHIDMYCNVIGRDLEDFILADDFVYMNMRNLWHICYLHNAIQV